jgi:predicted dehydrogenase
MRSRLRFGIIGSGLIAGIIADAMQATDEISLVAVASRRREMANAFALEHSIANVFDTYAELVAWNGLDAVYIATPTAVREEICLEAAKNRKHVLADKPFASLDSLLAITKACRDHGVAFMDATHFVHHPRTRQLKRELEQRIGKPQAIHTCFFFPSLDRDNIRLDPQKEPTGAIGDMAWYSMRAILEFMVIETTLVNASGYAHRDPITGAVVRGTGVMLFSDGSTSNWDVGYDCGALVMDLDILGERGMISLDDFVLDWQHNFVFENSQQTANFTQRSGVTNPDGYTRISVPNPQPQTQHMLHDFIALTADPQGQAAQASIRISEQTQGLLDAAWAGLIIGS